MPFSASANEIVLASLQRTQAQRSFESVIQQALSYLNNASYMTRLMHVWKRQAWKKGGDEMNFISLLQNRKHLKRYFTVKAANLSWCRIYLFFVHNSWWSRDHLVKTLKGPFKTESYTQSLKKKNAVMLWSLLLWIITCSHILNIRFHISLFTNIDSLGYWMLVCIVSSREAGEI